MISYTDNSDNKVHSDCVAQSIFVSEGERSTSVGQEEIALPELSLSTLVDLRPAFKLIQRFNKYRRDPERGWQMKGLMLLEIKPLMPSIEGTANGRALQHFLTRNVPQDPEPQSDAS